MNANEQLSALYIFGGHNLPGVRCWIEIDEYVPLQWRSYDEALGGGFVRLGNYSTTLIELAVEPHLQIVRGVTIISVDKLSPWPQFSVSDSVEEFPVISTNFEGYHIIDVKRDFEVSARAGEIVVLWCNLGESIAYACGPTRFLVRDGVLVGIWFTSLTDQQIALFASHARPDR